MNILITGGAGYIGSVVSEHLIIVGHHLFILDDLRDGNKSAVPAKAHFVQSDFGNEKTLFDLFSTKNIEVVIHLAALANVPDSVVNPIEYYENNISKTISLIKLMHQFEVKRIIFSSTAAVLHNLSLSLLSVFLCCRCNR